ncbi:MAG: extensin-like domain-containing protein [Hyphomicrobiales bacterium]
MRRSFQAAALAMALAGCSGSTGSYDPGDEGIIIPAGTCTFNPAVVPGAEHLGPVTGANSCRISDPWRLHTVSNVRLSVPATVNCGVISPLHGWLTDIVQPAAGRAFGERVAGVDVAASFACRPRNSNRAAKMSEHGLGNAIDISAFTLTSGRKVTVAAGWYGSPAERAFLREVHKKACGRFSTVLGPAADRYHRNHIHLDIQARKSRLVFCH